MATEPPREHESTYVVQDRSNLEEMRRIEIQDKLVTSEMGGVLPEMADPSHLRRVLDVGCGTGGWLIETAKQYPTIEKLIGVDISGKMLEYARAQAEKAGLDGRVQFLTMDALRILEFPEGRFDLVNQRFGMSWLRTWDWKKLLLEYRRVCRPGGIIRITESNVIPENNSPALTKMLSILVLAFYHSGRLFTAEGSGLTSELVHLMTQHGMLNIQTRTCTAIYRAGTVEAQYGYEDVQRVFRLLLPFFGKWVSIPSDYEETHQQALKDMQQPDFMSTAEWLTVWGTRPEDGGPVLMRGLP